MPYGQPVATATRAADLDEVFKALGDPTRRAVVARLGRGPTSTSVLAGDFEMALPSFVQHLEVLEHAGLVTSTKQGRVRTYRLTPDPLDEAAAWLAGQRDRWNRRFDQLDAHLESVQRIAKEQSRP